MHVAIIGPGNMGRALSARLLAGGHSISLVGKDRKQAEQVASELKAGDDERGVIEATDITGIEDAEVVILSLPLEASLDVAREHGRLLAGKIVVDISNPMGRSGAGSVPASASSGAEAIRTMLPADARLVKAFNTTFARTLVSGQVSGQLLDVFIAGDDEAANELVAELVSGSGMRPITVGGLERAHQLEALGLLGISIQEPLGTGYMTGWKLLFPGTEMPDGTEFPRNAVIGVLPDTSAIGQIVTELAAAGVEQSDVNLVMGTEGAAALRNARHGSPGILGSLFGFETEHTARHLKEVEAGRVVVVVEVADEAVADRVGQVLARHAATFVNYYSRWTARSLPQ